MATELAVDWLGRVPYAEALELQRKAVEARRAGAAPDRLLLLEHPPVITLGRRARREHLRASPDELDARGIAVHEVSRGGDVTYHGPGQLVGYPILDLAARGAADVHRYLRGLEAALVDALAELGVSSRTLPGYTGVFAGSTPDPSQRPRKLASIGVGVRGWVTCHGFALNVCLDLAAFDVIVPCGLHDVEMTSVAAELADAAPSDLAQRAREAVADAFTRRWS
ncbi:MAG: lipoyl(octanoyl) transferase LipB [Myxococcales bacterium]|nr:lipoyl(octanoyl) transferase LipB [Myxococcales bacterium]